LFCITVIQVFAELRRPQLIIVANTLTDNRPQAVQNIGASGSSVDQAGGGRIGGA
jgi:hypothetical protein